MQSRTLLAVSLLLAVCTGCIIHIGGSDWQGSHGLVHSDGDPGPLVLGDGIDATERREVPEFDALQSATSFDVKVRVGGERSVVLHGDQNVLPHVRTTVRGGSLEITLDRGSYRFESPTWIEITVPTLRAYALSGSGDTEIAGIDRDSFVLALSGSGDIAAVGRADHLSVSVSGSGDLELGELKAREVRVTVTGSSDVSLFASETLTIEITGSADVRYEGRPNITASITGSGSVRPR